MPSDVLTCPYCNTPAAAPPGARPGQRIPCPRCGESFPFRGPSDDAFTPSVPPPEPPQAPAPPPRRLSNGQVASLLLGGMAVMAVIGLVYALSTQGIRREYDFHLPKTKAISIPVYAVIPLVLYVGGLVAAWFWGWNRRDAGSAAAPPARRAWGLIGLSALVLLVVELAIVVMHARAPRPFENEAPPPAVQAVPPAELAALRYLPADTDFLLAVHVAELRDDPVGRDLLGHLGNDNINLQSLENWSGLKVDDIDHAVLGLTLDNDLPLHFTVVVRARRAIDRDKVRERLKAKPQRDLDDRTVYPFVMHTDLPLFRELDANLWFADDRTIVVAKRFADGPDHVIPTTPRADLDQLRPALRSLIAGRMGPSTRAWLAGRVPDEGSRFQPLSMVMGGDNEPVKKLKTFGVWVTTDRDGATMGGAFDCADEDGAKALKAYLAPANRKGIKNWLMAPDAGPMERAFAESMTITQDGTWVNLKARADAAAIRREK
jgi:hypothetical protein